MEENEFHYYSDYKKSFSQKLNHENPNPKYNFTIQNISSIDKDSNNSSEEVPNQKPVKKNQKLNNSIFFTINSYNSNDNNQNQKEENVSNEIKEQNQNIISLNIENNNLLIENENEDSESNSFNNEYQAGRWSKEEHQKFIEGILKYGNEWRKVQKIIKSRSSTQARSHAQKFFLKLKKELNAGVLSDSDKIVEYIISSCDKPKQSIKISSDQKEKLMSVIRSNLKSDENLNKSVKEGLEENNYFNSNNIDEKEESALDENDEENLGYNNNNLNFQKKMSCDINDTKRKLTFCSRKRKSSGDLSFISNYNKIFSISKVASHKNSIDTSKTNNNDVNNLTSKNTAEKNNGNKIIKFNIKNDYNNNLLMKNINNKKKEKKSNQQNEKNYNFQKCNFIIQNNYINVYPNYNNNINNFNNTQNVYNTQFNQNFPIINSEIKNSGTKVNSEITNQTKLNSNTNDIYFILGNRNFFPKENEQYNPFNINFENIISNNMKNKESYPNKYIGEMFEGGNSKSEWTENNFIQ